MHVVVIYNARSGRGRAAGTARAFAESLEGMGHHTAVHEAGGGGMTPELRDAAALVIVGGDGTLHHAVVDLVEAIGGGGLDTPPGLYQVPMGTENLFAREYGMTGDARQLDQLLRSGTSRPLDVGLCNGRAFVLMCGVGPDARVLARLNAASEVNGRRGPISHRSYVRPMLAELLSLKTPTLTVTVDGKPMVRGRQGILVVGNSRQYAMRLDPAVKASMSDGVLDAVFMPIRWRLEMIWWAVAARLRLHTSSPSLVYHTGRVLDISGGGPTPYQLDGESFTSPDGRLSISILPGALRVWA